jgi:lipopolysaccharide/colanic/teichoic acid biosynthesis glycosyltransferase
MYHPMIAERDRSVCGDARHPGTDGTGEAEPLKGYPRWKPTGDYLAALVLFVLTMPLLVLSMIVVTLTSRGPCIYSQVRLGRGGRPFRIYKVRTMFRDSESAGPRWSTAGDPRVTPVGRFLRRSHLDELPQLWNVLRGEMSLVGPRPERPEFAVQLSKAIPCYGDRLVVRPGVTGLAQVQLPPDTDADSVRRKLVCDLHYISLLSFDVDLKILVCTALALLGIPHSASRKLLGVPSLESSLVFMAQAAPVLTEQLRVEPQMQPA